MCAYRIPNYLTPNPDSEPDTETYIFMGFYFCFWYFVHTCCLLSYFLNRLLFPSLVSLPHFVFSNLSTSLKLLVHNWHITTLMYVLVACIRAPLKHKWAIRWNLRNLAKSWNKSLKLGLMFTNIIIKIYTCAKNITRSKKWAIGLRITNILGKWAIRLIQIRITCAIQHGWTTQEVHQY